MTAAVILSGGRSSRMGRPKALLPFRDTTFLGHLVAQFEAAGVHNILAVGGADFEAISNACGELLPVIEARDWAQGMRASLRAGVTALLVAGWTDEPFFVTHVDRPVFALQTLQALQHQGKPEDLARIPTFRGEGGHPVWLSPMLVPRLLKSDLEPLCDVLREAQAREIPVEDPDILLNLNTPADYEAFCAQREGKDA